MEVGSGSGSGSGSAEVLGLQDYISVLERTSLPRVLQVCSGVYFQGSVYELSGSEVCLSTGDLVKVTDFQLLSVSCEDISNNSTYELPLEHSGHFRLVPEELPYSTVEEMVSLLPVGVDACGSFTFISKNQLTVEDLTIPAETQITILSVERSEYEYDYARCRVQGQQQVSADIYLPLSLHGEFYECENERNYSLQEIMLSTRLSSRRFCKIKASKCDQPMIFRPIYQIQGIMHMRKNFVKFPSSLEVDVIDVTEQCKHLTFVTPLTLTEVTSRPHTDFPTMAEILEEPEANTFFSCSWFSQLRKGRTLVVHRCSKTQMILACTPKGRRAQQYFLISQDYRGQVRRKAREFNSVYDVYTAFSRCPGLRVSVTRHCEEVEEEGVPELSVGEQLEVLGLQTLSLPGASQNVENLICNRIMDDEDEDEDDDDESRQQQGGTVGLPLFAPINFVEKLLDKKKYGICELSRTFPLPLDVKVVNKDKVLETDPLSGLPTLSLEEALDETVVIVSFPERVEECFELPIRWLQLSLSFTSDPLPPASESCLQTVTEVTEHFHHEFYKLTKEDVAPPPRPPKRKPSASQPKKTKSKSKTKVPTKEVATLSLGPGKRTPPPPPEIQDDAPALMPRKSRSESLGTLNTYVKAPRKPPSKARKDNTVRTSSGSDHDYETVEDLKNPPDIVMFY